MVGSDYRVPPQDTISTRLTPLDKHIAYEQDGFGSEL